MTVVYARGYRRFEGERSARRLRLVPIFREGYATAMRGVVLLVLRLLFILVPLILVGFFMYFQSGAVADALRRMPGAAARDEADVARTALSVSILLFHEWTGFWIVLLTLLVGAGLVTDDLRTRALPLYLVRPITPLDYFLGKFLVPVAALATYALLPGVLLWLLGASLRPSGESLQFLVDTRRVGLALLEHFAVLATGYASLVLLVSTVARRRGASVVLGALLFLGGQLLAVAAHGAAGPLGELVRGFSLFYDSQRVLRDGLGTSLPWDAGVDLPSVEFAWGVPAALFAGCALAVLRRARTTEVVS